MAAATEAATEAAILRRIQRQKDDFPVGLIGIREKMHVVMSKRTAKEERKTPVRTKKYKRKQKKRK